MQTIILPDGYNGHTAKFNSKPVETDGNLIKLQCAEPGKEYMTRWTNRKEYISQFVQGKISERTLKQLLTV